MQHRDEVLWDQRRDIVVVFWTWCILPIRSLSPRIWRSVQCTVYTIQSTAVRGRGCMSSSGTLASKRQNTASPKFNDNNCLLISQYLISACSSTRIEYLLLQTTIWEKMDPKESFNIFRKLFPNFLRIEFVLRISFLLWLKLISVSYALFYIILYLCIFYSVLYISVKHWAITKKIWKCQPPNR
jgi:hypothetical protein